MILIDTHIWIWWINQDARLTPRQTERLLASQSDGIGVSIISVWETANLVRLGRIELTRPVDEWVRTGLEYRGIRLIDLTPKIAIEATELPGDFHKDPADRLIVATARVHNCPLLTIDSKLLAYPHVKTL